MVDHYQRSYFTTEMTHFQALNSVRDINEGTNAIRTIDRETKTKIDALTLLTR